MNVVDNARRYAAITAFLTLLVVIVAGSASLGAAEISVAERSIEATEPDPGDTVEITVEVQIDDSGDRLGVEEFFDPAFDSASIQDVTINGERETPVFSFADNEDGLLVALEPSDGFTAGDTVTVVYEVTVPEDADGTTFDIEGEFAIDDEPPVEHTGDAALTASSPSTPTETSTPESSNGDGSNQSGGAKETDTPTGTPSATPTPTSTATPVGESELETETPTATESPDSTPSPPDTSSDESTPTPTEEQTDGDGGGGLGLITGIIGLLLAGSYRLETQS